MGIISSQGGKTAEKLVAGGPITGMRESEDPFLELELVHGLVLITTKFWLVEKGDIPKMIKDSSKFAF
jgi:hypothetical protein